MKTYREIQGFFDYQNLFKQFIKDIPENGTMVECGAWLGKSSSFLCDIIEESGKNINLWIVDSWQGSKCEINTAHSLAKRADIYEIFLENMGNRKFNHIKAFSHEACKRFEDKSCDIVYIDMEHTYEAVKEDIGLWLPKVKDGGILAGHDYGARQWKDQVQRAVHEVIGKDNITVVPCGANASWVYQLDS